jgi:HAMP domain-containing protein
VFEALRDGDQGFVGAVGVDVRLSDLTRFLDSARVSLNSVAFIARGDGGLIAHSAFALDHDPAPDQNRPQSIASAGFKAGWPLEHALFATVSPGEPAVVFDYQGQAILGVANRIAAATEINNDAILFMAVPVKDFVGFAIRSNLATLAGAMALIALLIGVGFRVARQIASPIERLARLATQVGKTGFHDATPHPGSMIREIDDAGAAFNAMMVGLREREVMRDLFGKYVPERVVSDLIARGGALKPVGTVSVRGQSKPSLVYTAPSAGRAVRFFVCTPNRRQKLLPTPTMNTQGSTSTSTLRFPAPAVLSFAVVLMSIYQRAAFNIQPLLRA